MPAQVQITITADSTQAAKELKRLAGGMEELRTTTSKVMRQARGDTTGAIRAMSQAASEGTSLWARFAATLKGTFQVFMGLTLYDVAIRALHGIKALVGAGYEMNAMLESSFIAFTRAIGTMEGAARHLQELQDFAIRTAYDFKVLLEASKALQAWGYSAEQVIPIMEAVGNALVATGHFTEEYIGRVILALGQMRQKGKLYGQEARQLAEAGVPIGEAISYTFGKAVSASEKAQISAEDAIKALTKYISETPKYAKALLLATETLPGKIRLITEAGQKVLGYMAGPFYQGLKDVADRVGSFFIDLAANLRLPTPKLEGIETKETGTKAGKSLSEAFLAALEPGPVKTAFSAWLEALRETTKVAWALVQPLGEALREAFSVFGTAGWTAIASLGEATAAIARFLQTVLSLPGAVFAIDILIARFLLLPAAWRLIESQSARFQKVLLGIPEAFGFFAGELGVALINAGNSCRQFTQEAGVSWAAFGQTLRTDITMSIATLRTGVLAARTWATEIISAARTAAANFLAALITIAKGIASNIVSLETWKTFWQRTWANINSITLSGTVSVVGGIRWLGVAGYTLFRAFGVGLLTLARAVGKGILTFLGKNLWGMVLMAVAMALPAILQNWRTFAAAFIDTGKAIWTSLKALGTSFTSFAGAVGKTVYYATTRQIEKIPEAWQEAIQQITGSWQGVGTLWKKAAGEAWVGVKEVFKETIAGPTFELPELPEFELPKIEEPGKAAFAPVKEGATEAGEAVKKTAKEASEEAKKAAEDTANALKSIIPSIGQTFSDALQSFGEDTLLASMRIRFAFSNLLAEMESIPEAGSALGQTFKEALSLVPALAEGSRDALAELTQIVQRLLAQIASRLQELGRDAPEQVREGLLEAQKVAQDVALRVTEAWQQMYDRTREMADRQYEFFYRVGAISAERYLSYIYSCLRQVKAGIEDELRLREEAYNLAMDWLDSEIKKIKEVWDARIKAVEDAVEQEIAIREQALEALDEEEEQAEREEAAREHSEKLRKIDEEIAYHRVRTGREHQKKLQELLEERAEEEREFLNRQADWEREDRREQLQDEIDDLREQGRRQIVELERQRDEVLDTLENEWKKKLALAAAYSPEFFEKMKGPFELLLNYLQTEFPTRFAGLITGAFPGLEQALAPIRALVGQAGTIISQPVETLPPAEETRMLPPASYREMNGRAWAWARDLGSVLGLPVDWDEAKKQAVVGGKHFTTRLDIVPDQGWVPVREVGEAFGYTVRWQGAGKPIEFVRRAHSGARVLSGGLAELAPGELIFPSNLAVKLERLISLLQRQPLALAGASGLTFNAPLSYIEHAHFEDEADIEIFSRELRRQITILRRF